MHMEAMVTIRDQRAMDVSVVVEDMEDMVVAVAAISRPCATSPVLGIRSTLQDPPSICNVV